MFVHSITAIMIASLLIAQTPVPAPQIAPPATQNAPAAAGQNLPEPTVQNAPAPTAQAITVPTGTTVQLTLMSAIKSKSTKPGDTVRAVIAFPVTIGAQLAIPAGTFAEGVVSQVTARPKRGQQPSFRVHFTRLVFSNGYSVALNGENTEALVLPESDRAPAVEVAELTPIRLPGARFAIGEGQQPPQLPPLPPLPQVGPSPAVIGGIAGGISALIVIGMLVGMHHGANSTDFMLFDAGWQFQMVLDSPVTLDTAQVAAAAAAPSAN
jgi:type IV secretion system protein VirB10